MPAVMAMQSTQSVHALLAMQAKLAGIVVEATCGWRGLGVSRQPPSKPFNAKAGVSVEMAIRLLKAFGSGPET